MSTHQLVGRLGGGCITHAEHKRPVPAETPYRDGKTHLIFAPLDSTVRLAARVPNSRVNLTRYHRVNDVG